MEFCDETYVFGFLKEMKIQLFFTKSVMLEKEENSYPIFRSELGMTATQIHP